MIMFKTSAHDQCANVRLGRQIWHSRTDREHLGTGLNQCANARLGVQIWHLRAERDHYMSVPKCSRSARECQIRCADLAFAH